MAKHHVGERRRADTLVVGAAVACPPFRRHGAHKAERRVADADPLVEHFRQRPPHERAARHVGVLVEAGQRGLVAPPDAQETIREDSLDIGEVTDDFGNVVNMSGVSMTLSSSPAVSELGANSTVNIASTISRANFIVASM